MSSKKMSSKDVMNLLHEEVYIPLKENPTEETLKKVWKPAFIKVLRGYYGFNKKAAKTMFKWGEHGHNWEVLHHKFENDLSEGSTSLTHSEIIEKFICEVHYISDRISLDRLLRTHHIYNSYDLLTQHFEVKEMNINQERIQKQKYIDEKMKRLGLTELNFDKPLTNFDDLYQFVKNLPEPESQINLGNAGAVNVASMPYPM